MSGYIVRLHDKCWVLGEQYTTVEHDAQKFDTKAEAQRALRVTRTFGRAFKKASIVECK